MAALGLKARFITRNPKEPSEVQLELSRLGLEWTTAPFGYHWGKYIFGRYFYYIFLNLYGVGATSLRLWRGGGAGKPSIPMCRNGNNLPNVAPRLLALRFPLIYRPGVCVR